MKRSDAYIQIIDKLLSYMDSTSEVSSVDEVYFQVVTLIGNLYKDTPEHLKNLTSFKTKNWDETSKNDYPRTQMHNFLKGILRGIKGDLQNGLIRSLEQEITGSVVADFLVFAKSSINEGFKDVGAVLGSAALEDALKRYALLNNLDVEDKDMSEVINSLKSQGLLQGPQAKVISSYVTLRNKAFHAEFDKIEMPEVKSLLAFTEEFILKSLS